MANSTGPATLGGSAQRYSATCGKTQVYIVRDSERWIMYAGFTKTANRCKDFASPYLEHAMRTAEAWFGKATGSWRGEDGNEFVNVDKGRESYAIRA